MNYTVIKLTPGLWIRLTATNNEIEENFNKHESEHK